MEKEMLKNVFVEVKNKFETGIGILKKEKITIAPEDPAAVSHYANVMKTVREKLVSTLPHCFHHNLSAQYITGIVILQTFIVISFLQYMLCLQLCSTFSRANLLSESQDIQATIDLETQDIPDARTYLLTLKEIRTKSVMFYSTLHFVTRHAL